MGVHSVGNLRIKVIQNSEGGYNHGAQSAFLVAPGIASLAPSSVSGQEAPKAKKLKIMMKSAWGSDDPTRASFVFAHGLALADAGHDVQIFLTGEATYTMRKATVNAIMPVGWPPLSETIEKVVAKHIPIFILRSLFPGPWGHGSRSEPMGSKIWQPGDFCIPGGMGGSNHHRISRA